MRYFSIVRLLGQRVRQGVLVGVTVHQRYDLPVSGTHFSQRFDSALGHRELVPPCGVGNQFVSPLLSTFMSHHLEFCNLTWWFGVREGEGLVAVPSANQPFLIEVWSPANSLEADHFGSFKLSYLLSQSLLAVLRDRSHWLNVMSAGDAGCGAMSKGTDNCTSLQERVLSSDDHGDFAHSLSAVTGALLLSDLSRRYFCKRRAL